MNNKKSNLQSLIVTICSVFTVASLMLFCIGIEMYFSGIIRYYDMIIHGCIVGVCLGTTLGLIDRFKYADRIR